MNKKRQALQRRYNLLAGRHLCHLLGCRFRKETPGEIPDEALWDEILRISRRHGLASLSYQAAMAGEEPPYDDLRESWERAADRDLVRSFRRSIAREEIEGRFRKDGLDLVPLRGLVLAEGYSAPEHRDTMELDYLVREESRKDAASRMKSLGYRLVVREGHRDLYARGTLWVRLHRRLLPDGSPWAPLFRNPWNRSREVLPGYWRLDEDLHALYALACFRTGYLQGSSGLRDLTDLWLNRSGRPLPRTALPAGKDVRELLAFGELMEDLAARLFEDRPLEAFQEDQLAYLLSMGCYASPEGRARQGIRELLEEGTPSGKARRRYLKERILPSREVICLRYPRAHYHRPLYQAYLALRLLEAAGNLPAHFRELRALARTGRAGAGKPGEGKPGERKKR